jgi:hypothetical protein
VREADDTESMDSVESPPPPPHRVRIGCGIRQAPDAEQHKKARKSFHYPSRKSWKPLRL